jgi:hypothetical protein
MDLLQLGGQLGAHLNDLGKFFYGTRAWLDGGSLYAPNPATRMSVALGVEKELLNLNPPHFHLLLAPFARLPEQAIFGLWLLTSALGAGWSWHRTRPWLGPWPLSAMATAGLALAFLASGPIQFWLATGQPTFQLLPLVVLAWAAAREERWVAAGLWLGVAAAIKPFFALLIVWAALRGDWRALPAGALPVAIAYGVGLLVFGPAAYAEWGATVAGIGWHSLPGNGSFEGFFERLLTDTFSYDPLLIAPDAVQTASRAAFVAVGALSLAFATLDRGEVSTDRGFTLLLVAAWLMSPLGWTYYTLWAALPLLCLWLRAPWTGFAKGAVLAGVLLHVAEPWWTLGWDVASESAPPLALRLTIGSAGFWCHALVWLGLLASARPAIPEGARRAVVLASSAAAGALAIGVIVAASLPVAPSTPRLVALVVLDGVSAQETSLCGPEGATPMLDHLASRGAWTCGLRAPEAGCAPSHASYLTGHDTVGTGVIRREWEAPPLAPTAETLAEAFAARGYRTAAIVGNAVVGPRAGLDQGFERFAVADRVEQAIASAVDGFGPDDRVFLLVNLPADRTQPDAIARADDALAAVLAAMRDAQLLGGSYRIVITADHGFAAADPLSGPGSAVSEALLRVPLVVATTERPPRLDVLVDGTAVFPLVLDGVSPDPRQIAEATVFVAESGPQVARWDGPIKRVWADGKVVRYNVSFDPHEQSPTEATLAEDPELGALVERATAAWEAGPRE